MTREAFDMTLRDLQAWRRLVKHARGCAADPTAPAGDLRAAATARNVVCPSAEARDNICIPLRRLGAGFAALNGARRAEAAPELRRLADALAALVGETKSPRSEPATIIGGTVGMTDGALKRLGLHLPPEPLLADDPRPEPRPRADIDG